MRRSPRWTPEEDKILRELYPGFPAKIVLRSLPGRTAKAIHWHAKYLGIRRDFKTSERRATVEPEAKPSQTRGAAARAKYLAICAAHKPRIILAAPREHEVTR